MDKNYLSIKKTKKGYRLNKFNANLFFNNVEELTKYIKEYFGVIV